MMTGSERKAAAVRAAVLVYDGLTKVIAVVKK
jgi:hypothetical protein